MAPEGGGIQQQSVRRAKFQGILKESLRKVAASQVIC